MKRKATIIILTAVLIGSFFNEIYSQELYRFQSHRNKVIAANGLNMRSKPNTKSTKLVNIPYGETVQILHKDHYGLDTVYTIETELGDHAVFGYWQKVQYKEYVGYIHSAFLTYSKQYGFKPSSGVNEDIVIVYPGYHCNEVFYNSNEYIWYGYYEEVDNEIGKSIKSYRKQITVQFINVPAEMTGCGTIVKENRNLKFIIGSKKEFGESDLGDIMERNLYDIYTKKITNRKYPDSLVLDSKVLEEGRISMIRNTEPSSYFDQEFFYLKTAKSTQLINKVTDTYRIRLAQYFIEADLDGDGELDYLFYHGEEDRRIGLYLSSEGDEEEGVKMVSLLFRGSCC